MRSSSADRLTEARRHATAAVRAEAMLRADASTDLLFTAGLRVAP